MSDLDEMELDVTLLHNRAFEIKRLEGMKKKYSKFPNLVDEIEKQIKEKEKNEHDR